MYKGGKNPGLVKPLTRPLPPVAQYEDPSGMLPDMGSQSRPDVMKKPGLDPNEIKRIQDIKKSQTRVCPTCGGSGVVPNKQGEKRQLPGNGGFVPPSYQDQLRKTPQ